ncbi:MAG TPA: hypothetical protein VGB91_08060, partial [Rhizomicrobium sp.]
LAKAILARNLWLQGYPDQAIECARAAVEEAAAMDHSLTLAIALIWAITVLLWTGELQGAGTYIDMLVSRAESHSLAPYLLVARGFKGDIAIRQGNAGDGVEDLQGTLRKLHAAPYELLTTELHLSLIGGLSALGRIDEAIALADETLAGVEMNGTLLHSPELLRMKGSILLARPASSRDEAETCFSQALALSRRQGARAWEMRTAIDVARLMAGRGDATGAHGLLQPVFEGFAEGSGTADLTAAKSLLATLR